MRDKSKKKRVESENLKPFQPEPANELRLSKESPLEEMKAYFDKVFELKKSGELFPVDLEEVWPLVYAAKDKAVRALKKNFIEEIDYITQYTDNQPLTQNGERKNNGQFTGEDKVIYKLSVSCLEYFIARKVRPVFEVYRVALERYNEYVALFDARIAKLEERMDEAAASQRLPAPEGDFYYTAKGYETVFNAGRTPKIKLAPAELMSIGKMAARMCREQGVEPGVIPDSRYGTLNEYPKRIIKEAYRVFFLNPRF